MDRPPSTPVLCSLYPRRAFLPVQVFEKTKTCVNSMHSLASHLEKLSWEKERKSVVLQASSSPLSPTCAQVEVPVSTSEAVTPIGRYLVPLDALEGETKSTTCLDASTGVEHSCRVYDFNFFQRKAVLFSTGYGKGVHPIEDVLLTDTHAFVFSDINYGDLHQYLREKKRLTEVEAAPLFQQIVELVRDAHSRGIVLRDIKLKKFIFEDVLR